MIYAGEGRQGGLHITGEITTNIYIYIYRYTPYLFDAWDIPSCV